MSIAEALPNPSVPIGIPVPLLHLQTLNIEMHIQKVSSLLSTINTSPTALTFVNIVLAPWSHGSLELPDHSSLSATTLLSLPSSQTLPMLTRMVSMSFYWGRVVTGRGPLPKHPEAEAAHIAIDFDNTYDEDDVMSTAYGNFVDSLAEHYTLDGLHGLRLKLFHPARVVPMLRIAPGLRKLVLNTTPVLETLRVSVAGRAETLYPLVPELEAIVFVKCVLTRDDVRTLPLILSQLDIRVLSLERCGSEVDDAWIVSTLKTDSVEVRWLVDDPEHDLRIEP
ncbi:hypothetical protein BD413DRAFT_611934 [Trametes elegans]|nr:hypothetical protein BD413DRAFT_611934 [Trametes elegans]